MLTFSAVLWRNKKLSLKVGKIRNIPENIGAVFSREPNGKIPTAEMRAIARKYKTCGFKDLGLRTTEKLKKN